MVHLPLCLDFKIKCQQQVIDVGESPMKKFKSSIQKADDEMIHDEGFNDLFEDPFEKEEMISTPIKPLKESNKSKTSSTKKYAKKSTSPMGFKFPTEINLNSPTEPLIPKHETLNSPMEKKKSLSRQMNEITQSTKDFVNNNSNISQESNATPGNHNTMRKTTSSGVNMESPILKKRGRPRKDSLSPTVGGSVYVEEDDEIQEKTRRLIFDLEDGLLVKWPQRISWTSQTEEANSICDFAEVLLEFVDYLKNIFVSNFNIEKMKDKIGKILNFADYWKVLLEIKSNIEGKHFNQDFDHQRWVEKLKSKPTKDPKKKGK
jgi:hypothetical protein